MMEEMSPTKRRVVAGSRIHNAKLMEVADSLIHVARFTFEAHMEVHVGSIDEEEDEQGIAHMIEHVAFLGSKKREKLLGTGARSNAYTDFHHTVFHIHSPTSTKVRHLRQWYLGMSRNGN
ncbi:putative zinc protease [Nymphaea thermarum]|nr:putative zinc protease [Nymphaea thermarum]